VKALKIDVVDNGDDEVFLEFSFDCMSNVSNFDIEKRFSVIVHLLVWNHATRNCIRIYLVLVHECDLWLKDWRYNCMYLDGTPTVWPS
jgi:hypothetical protein